MGEKRSVFKKIYGRTGKHRSTFFVYLFLRLCLYALSLYFLFSGKYKGIFYCATAFLLFLLPFITEAVASVELPAPLEIAVLLFIFCSVILGEAAAFYVRVPLWDSLLHTFSGFLCAGIGFSLAELLNRRRRVSALSPLFLAVVAFSFAMTIGVLWEFFEFFADVVLHTDMQKDFIVDRLWSVALDPSKSNAAVGVEGIARTVLYGENGEILAEIEGGFLDAGVIDTMKDLILNFLGALVFTLIAFFTDGKKSGDRFLSLFVPRAAEGAKGAEREKTEKNGDR